MRIVSTGHVNLDLLLGGGFQYGGLVEVYGPPSSGKTTLALQLMQLASRSHKRCLYIDAEKSLSPARAFSVLYKEGKPLTPDVDSCYYCGVGDVLLLYQILQRVAFAYDLVVVDTWTALTAEGEKQLSYAKDMLANWLYTFASSQERMVLILQQLRYNETYDALLPGGGWSLRKRLVRSIDLGHQDILPWDTHQFDLGTKSAILSPNAHVRSFLLRYEEGDVPKS